METEQKVEGAGINGRVPVVEPSLSRDALRIRGLQEDLVRLREELANLRKKHEVVLNIAQDALRAIGVQEKVR